MITPHEHEWDYIGTKISDADCLTPLYHLYKCWFCKKEKRVYPDIDSFERKRLIWILSNL